MLTLVPPVPAPEPPLPRRLITDSSGHAGIIVCHQDGCVRQVRRWLSQSTHSTPTVGAAVIQAASELVTNALRHTRSGWPRGTTTVELLHRPSEITLRVSDDGPRDPNHPSVPRRIDADELAESGRGLALVEKLAARWVWERRPDGGITVIATFTKGTQP